MPWDEIDRRRSENGDDTGFLAAAGEVVERDGVARMRRASKDGASGGGTSRATRGDSEAVP